MTQVSTSKPASLQHIMKPELVRASADSASMPPEKWHRHLAQFNVERLRPGVASGDWAMQLQNEYELRELEAQFIETERAKLSAAMADVPGEAAAFMAWFENLRSVGPGQNDPLFDWLAEYADWNQMSWFLTQEAAGEAGFDDLVAMTQVRFPLRAKLELARNYWDEMGRGAAQGVHGAMLEATVKEMALAPSIATTVWEALALANLMVALAANRRFAYQSIGALGVIEMTAPGRVAKVNQGLRRLGVSAAGRRYFQLHAGLDIRHSASWNTEIIEPLVAANPALALPIAEGALLRLSFGERCFRRYRTELGVDVTQRIQAKSEARIQLID